MTAAGAKSYSYDAAGRTTSVTVGGNTTTLAYDYENRITTITYPDNSTNTFTYNGLDTRVGKVDSAGTKTFRRDGVGVTDPVLSDGAASYTPGISERRSGTSKFYHSNHLGTNTAITDSSQATTDTKTYDAFGLLTASTGSTPTPFGFAGDHGYQEDADSGLKLLGHRYYDPSTGRFLTRDKIKDGRNWYGYCENNPMRNVDPEGLDPMPWPFNGRVSRVDADPEDYIVGGIGDRPDGTWGYIEIPPTGTEDLTFDIDYVVVRGRYRLDIRFTKLRGPSPVFYVDKSGDVIVDSPLAWKLKIDQFSVDLPGDIDYWDLYDLLPPKVQLPPYAWLQDIWFIWPLRETRGLNL